MIYTEKIAHEMATDVDKNVRRRRILQVFRNGKLFGSEVLDNRLIKPDDDITNESRQVRRELSTVFIPTIIDIAAARTAHRAARELRQEAVAALEAAVIAYEEAVAGGDQAEIDAALIVRQEATAAKNAAREVAQAARDALDAAIAAHEAFIAAEG